MRETKLTRTKSLLLFDPVLDESLSPFASILSLLFVSPVSLFADRQRRTTDEKETPRKHREIYECVMFIPCTRGIRDGPILSEHTLFPLYILRLIAVFSLEGGRHLY